MNHFYIKAHPNNSKVKSAKEILKAMKELRKVFLEWQLIWILTVKYKKKARIVHKQLLDLQKS